MTNPSSHAYEDYQKLLYGAEPSWLTSFQAFYDHIGPQPQDGRAYSIGRIDNDVGYIAGNVRWETATQQNRNKSKLVTNTSGVTGVTWRDDCPAGRAIATWVGLDGISKSKSFSAKYSSKGAAILLAAEYRKEMIAHLNSQGAGYADKHGE